MQNYWIALVGILVCIIALERATNYFVDNLGIISRYFHIPGATMGASVAAIGSSAPEFGTSLFSVLEAHPDIGLGTIIGSAIFNITVIIGIVVGFGVNKLDKSIFWRDGLFYLLTVGVVTLGVLDNHVTRFEAIAWSLLFMVYLAWLMKSLDSNAEPHRNLNIRKSIVYVVFTLVAIGITAYFLVRFTVGFTSEMGISEAMFSLIVVAIGTSIPDLFTSAQAARKGWSSLAISNAIGSNTFDMLICLGIPLSFREITPIHNEIGIAIPYLLISLVLVLILLRFADRKASLICMTLYLLFLLVLV